LVSFGTQNLQEYNMANGFLSQLAAARSSQRSLGGLSGLQLGRASAEEMRSLQDEIRRMEERAQEEEQSARKREGRRGRGRLAGGVLGGILATAAAGLAPFTGGGSLLLAAGAGLGSYAGQELGARGLGTSKGLGSRKRRLGRIQKGFQAPGLFHEGKREDIEFRRKDLNKFLKDADRQFDEQILSSSLTDALTAYGIGETDLGKFARSTDPEGKGLGFIKGFKAMKKAKAAKAAMGAVGTSNIGAKSISDVLGGEGLPDFLDYGQMKDAFADLYPNREVPFSNFLKMVESGLPGQGFGDRFDAGGWR
jgi:hypothetical protein